MPSLTTNNQMKPTNIGTFDYSIGKYTCIKPTKLVSCADACCYMTCLCIIATFTCLGVLLIELLSIYFGNKNDSDYNKYHVYLINDYFYIIVGLGCSFGYIIGFITHTHSTNPKMHYFCCVFIYFIMNGILLYWTRWDLYKKHGIWYFKFIKFDCNQIFNCHWFLFFYVYLQCFIFFSPIFHCMLIYIMFWVKMTIAKRDGTIVDMYTYICETRLQMKIITYLMVYWFVYLIFCLFALFYSNVKYTIFEKNWEEWFLGWIFLTSCFKFILKKISRWIDKARVRLMLLQSISSNYNTHRCGYTYSYQSMCSSKIKICNFQESQTQTQSNACAYTNANDGSYNYKLFSMEWITELSLSLIYWFMYRACYLSYMMSLNQRGILVILIAIHLMSESFETSLRLSKTYFDITDKIMQVMINCGNLSGCIFDNRLYKKFFFDDSNYSQWTKRYSIDITIRFCVSIITGVYELIVISIAGKYQTVYDLNTSDKMKKAIEATLISLFGEIMYYGVAIALHSACDSDNLIGNCISVWKMYGREFTLVFVSSLFITNYIYNNSITGVSV